MKKVSIELSDQQFIEYTAAAAVYGLTLAQFIHCELKANYNREKLALNEPENRKKFNIDMKYLKNYV
jgi:hypothetical protein